MSEKERKIVGSPLNFRGLVYAPINEQGVVYLFGLIANDLNIRVESIQQGYPDCTAVRFAGKGKWERINIEFEFRSSGFNHDPDKCDVLVCWEDDLPEAKRGLVKGLEIYELKSRINTPEVPNIQPKDPEETQEAAEYDLNYHFNRKNVTKSIQELFVELDEQIRSIDESIWVKFAQTAITYYSPERTFVYLRLRKNSLALDIYTGQNKVDGVQNIKDHENWGTLHIHNKKELEIAISAIAQSFHYIREAIKNNENTGWYALTPKDKNL
jgi:predicted transport protein